MRRIGIFGGSFNPIHNGHLHLAKTAMQQFDLQHVLFIPTYISPFKRTAKDVADGTHRLAMCRLAIAPYPAFSVSDYELRQKTVSYTVHTISNLHAEQPDAALVLLMGSDMLLQFQNWYHWQEILSMAELGVIARETDDRIPLEQAAKQLSAYGTIQLFCDAVLPVSSTKIREMLKKNQDCTCYLPEKVVKYIVFHQLYRSVRHD